MYISNFKLKGLLISTYLRALEGQSPAEHADMQIWGRTECSVIARKNTGL